MFAFCYVDHVHMVTFIVTAPMVASYWYHHHLLWSFPLHPLINTSQAWSSVGYKYGSSYTEKLGKKRTIPTPSQTTNQLQSKDAGQFETRLTIAKQGNSTWGYSSTMIIYSHKAMIRMAFMIDWLVSFTRRLTNCRSNDFSPRCITTKGVYFSPPGKCVGHSLKTLRNPEKILRPPWCPKPVTGLLPRLQTRKFISCFVIGSSSFELVGIQPFSTIFPTLRMKTWYKNEKNSQSKFFQNCSTTFVFAYFNGRYCRKLNTASSA